MSEVSKALDGLQSDPLFAILPVGREVAINNGKALVVGVSWNVIGKTLRRFPQLAQYLTEAQDQAGGAVNFGLWLVTNVSEAVPSILAAGIGRPDDPNAEAILGRLGALEQTDLVNEVLKETIGGDLDFFLSKLKAVAATVGYGAGGEAERVIESGRIRRMQRASAA